MYVQAIGSWTEDRCLFQDFSERTFSRQQGAIEEVLKGGKGRKWYIKSDMLKSLSDDVIQQSCERFCGVPDGCSRSSLLHLKSHVQPRDTADSNSMVV